MSTATAAAYRETTEYRDLLRIVRSADVNGALILGGVGIGKTSLVEAVLEHSDLQSPVMRLYCSPSLAEEPYGVLSPYLGALRSIEDPVQVLREINQSLAGRSAQAGGLVIVEDAQHLDAQTCFVLSLLAENASLKLLAIGGGVLDAGSPLAAMSASMQLETIVVQPLGLDHVRAIAGQLVPGILGDGAGHVISHASGGNPSFAKAYVASGLEQGILFSNTPRDASPPPRFRVWTTARALPAADERLCDLVREVHQLIPEGERRCLQLLALAGALPSRLLLACALPFRGLLDSGELRLAESGGVEFASELHAMVLRQMVPAQVSAELYEQWYAARAELGLEPSPRQILWGLEIGRDVPQVQVLAAVRQAAGELDYALAWKLCSASQLSQSSAAGALLEAQVMLGMGRYHSARSLLLRTIEHDDEPERLREAFNQLLLVLTSLGVKAEELQALEALWDERARRFGNSPQAEQLVLGRKLAHRLMALWKRAHSTDGVRPQISEVEQLLDEPDLSPEARVITLMLLSDLHSIEGHCQSAYELAMEARGVLAANPTLDRLYEAKVAFRVGWNLVFLGHYRRAEQFLAGYRGLSVYQVMHRQGVIATLEGLAALAQGRTVLASEKFTEAVAELRLHDPAQLLFLAEHLYRAAESYLGSVPVPGVDQWEVPSDAAALGEVSSLHRLFARAVAAGLGRPLGSEAIADFPLLEREALIRMLGQVNDSDLAGHPGRDRLIRLAERQQGLRAALAARLAELGAERDAAQLAQLGQDAVGEGELELGVVALARAAARYSEQGEQRSCGALLRQVARIVDAEGMDPGRYVSRTLALTELTARETEIVDLARAGKNNAEIARILTVSQRTVEGHLYRVFAKLGISERAELNDAGLQPGNGLNR